MTDLQKGLDEQQAAERLAEYGENRIDPPKGRSALGIFFSQFCDILIVILAAAAVFSVTVGEFTEAVSILAIMLLNAAMGFVQEYRTERTLARLAELSAPLTGAARGKDGRAAVVRRCAGGYPAAGAGRQRSGRWRAARRVGA